MTAPFVDAYSVLGVAPAASQEELKAAHRRLVRRHHPDLAPAPERDDATRRVQEINAAYALVRDPRRRADYDDVRRRWAAAAPLRAAGAAAARAGAPAAVDAALARRWTAMAEGAGREAGRWWRRNRTGVLRGALRARRLGADLLGRVAWLLSCAAWTVGGLVLVTAVQRLSGSDGVIAPLVAALGGLLVGSQRGWALRLRFAGVPTSRRRLRLETLAYVAAVGLGLFADVRL